jgi:hypothetical protein
VDAVIELVGVVLNPRLVGKLVADGAPQGTNGPILA